MFGFKTSLLTIFGADNAAVYAGMSISVLNVGRERYHLLAYVWTVQQVLALSWERQAEQCYQRCALHPSSGKIKI